MFIMKFVRKLINLFNYLKIGISFLSEIILRLMWVSEAYGANSETT